MTIWDKEHSVAIGIRKIFQEYCFDGEDLFAKRKKSLIGIAKFFAFPFEVTIIREEFVAISIYRGFQTALMDPQDFPNYYKKNIAVAQWYSPNCKHATLWKITKQLQLSFRIFQCEFNGAIEL